jgi:hypothetical protein
MMPYSLPTPLQVTERFAPRFDALPLTRVGYAIEEAARFVDNTWFEGDYQPAIMHLAAHILVSEGALGGEINTSGPLQSKKLGDASKTWGSFATMSASEFSGTSFGRRFLAIQKANVPAVVVL